MPWRSPSALTFPKVLAAVCFLSDAAIATEHEQRLVDLIGFMAPEGSGPHPVVVLVSGCNGFESPAYQRREDRLKTMGFATARVDYMEARDAGGCAYQPTKSRIARDISFVVEHLSGLEAVKRNSINVLGWSSGGGGALSMMSKLQERSDLQVATVSAFYPVCANVFPWSGNVPVLMLLASDDNIAPAALCKKLAGKINDANIEVREYAGAYHGFEDSDLPQKSEGSFGTMGYDEEASENAWSALAGFFVR